MLQGFISQDIGDPELPMWSEEHSSLSVSHTSSIVGNSTVDVTVTSTGNPLENARVCIQKGDWQTGEVYDVGYTDASGNAHLWASPETTGQIDITVWAYNHDHYSGLIDVTQVGLDPEPDVVSYSLEQVYPNPATGNVSITFATASAGPVELTVYDMQGRQVSVLVIGTCSPGRYTCVWNIESTGTSRVSSGLYFVRFMAGSFTEAEPLLILR